MISSLRNRSGRSTVDFVKDFCVFVTEAKEDDEVVDAVFCDLSKAHDCVSHDPIMRKLECLGVSHDAKIGW